MGKLPPVIWQLVSTDCGAACLVSVCRYFGLHISLQQASCLFAPSRHGVSLLALGRAARTLGFRTAAYRVDYDWLVGLDGKPCIAHWRGNHYVVVCRASSGRVTIMDPARGRISMCRRDFERGWCASADALSHDSVDSECCRGVVLSLDVGDNGLSLPDSLPEVPSGSVSMSPGIFSRYRGVILAVFAILGAIGLLDVGVPICTSLLFDSGMGAGSVTVILIALGGQLCITLGRSAFSALQSFVTLRAGNKLYLDLATELFGKFARLPRSFFDFKSTGETLQSSFDITRIEMFVTQSLPVLLTSCVSVIVAVVMLTYYDPVVIALYVPFFVTHCIWLSLFMKRRRGVDMNLYELQARNNDMVIEYVKGMLELRLTDRDGPFRQRWHKLREKYYRESRKSLAIEQKQSVGMTVLSRVADLAVVFVTAMAVVRGNMSLGTMMAVQYLVGTLSHPAGQLVMFVRQLQDYRISMARLSGVCALPDEPDNGSGICPRWEKGLRIVNVSMAYNLDDGNVVENISFDIPKGSTVAIVGESGSGKSTLLKMLLGLYLPASGSILIDDIPMDSVDLKHWRKLCMTAFCDNYVFDDTLAANIALDGEDYDNEKMREACKMACLDDVVATLPNGLKTHLGPGGRRLSTGQRQRVVLARAFYFHPAVLILDEATNALDTETERRVYDNIYSVFADATVVVAAHRLSTICHADNIIVMHNGRVSESGTHDSLVSNAGLYARMFDAQSTPTNRASAPPGPHTD